MMNLREATVRGGSSSRGQITDNTVPGSSYLTLPQESVLPRIRKDLGENGQFNLQDEEARALRHRRVRASFGEDLPKGWVGRKNFMSCPLPDPTPLDFFLWANLKDEFYAGNAIEQEFAITPNDIGGH